MPTLFTLEQELHFPQGLLKDAHLGGRQGLKVVLVLEQPLKVILLDPWNLQRSGEKHDYILYI